MMKNTFAVFGAITALVLPFAGDTDVFAQSANLPTGWIAADVGDIGIAGRSGIEFMTRRTDGGDTTFIAGGFMPFPAWCGSYAAAIRWTAIRPSTEASGRSSARRRCRSRAG